jgi:hypothetical protein
MKIHLVGAELFHADARTDRCDVPVTICSFANAPKKLLRIGDFLNTVYLLLRYQIADRLVPLYC